MSLITRNYPSKLVNDIASKNFISGSGDCKRVDQELQRLIYLTTFRTDWIILERSNPFHLEQHRQSGEQTLNSLSITEKTLSLSIRRQRREHREFGHGYGIAARLRRRSNRVSAVATDPKPAPVKTVNGSSSKSPSTKPVNGVSQRTGDVSKEIKRVRTQMEEDEQLATLMRGLQASITAYWGKRPRSVATRIVQLLSVAGGFLSRVVLCHDMCWF